MGTAGSIVIDLLLKTGSFETDSKRAEKRMRELGKEAKQMGAVLGTAIAAGAGIAVAAINSSIDRIDELSKAAQRVGVSTESFSALAYAGGLADVSMDELQTSMGRLTKSQAEAVKATSAQAKVFSALGIEVTDASGRLREADDVFADFADAFQRHQGSPEIMAAGMEIFGRSFQNLIPLLKDGSQGLREAAEEARKLGQIISTDTGRAAEQFNDNLHKMGALAGGLANRVAAELLPDLEKLTAEWVTSATEGDKLATTAKGVADVFRVLGEAADFAGTIFNRIDAEIQGMTMALQGAVEVAKGFINLNWDQVARGAALSRTGVLEAAFGRTESAPSAGRPKVNIIDPADLLAEDKRRVEQMRRARAESERLMKLAFGDAPKALKATRSPSAGRARDPINLNKDAARELQQLIELEDRSRTEFESWAATLEGPVSDAVYQYGADLDRLNKLAEDGAVYGDQLTKAQENLRKEHEANVKAIQERLEPGKQLLDDLQFELDLMKLTNAERATAIQLRGLDTEQVRKYGEEIAETNRKLMENAEQADFMDGWRGEFQDFFSDVLSGTKSIGDAFEDMLTNIGSMIAERIAQNWVDQLFGEMGTTNGGAAGGGEGGWFQAIAGAFSGSRASGGDVLANRGYWVGEEGPEWFQPRTAGTVLTNETSMAMAGRGGQVVNNNQFLLQGKMDYRSQQQAAERVGIVTNVAMRRNS